MLACIIIALYNVDFNYLELLNRIYARVMCKIVDFHGDSISRYTGNLPTYPYKSVRSSWLSLVRFALYFRSKILYIYPIFVLTRLRLPLLWVRNFWFLAKNIISSDLEFWCASFERKISCLFRDLLLHRDIQWIARLFLACRINSMRNQGFDRKSSGFVASSTWPLVHNLYPGWHLLFTRSWSIRKSLVMIKLTKKTWSKMRFNDE